jgi:hypothetical protein
MKAVQEEIILKALNNVSCTHDGAVLIAWIEESRDDLIKISMLAGNDRDARISASDKAQELSELLNAIEGAEKELKTISRGTSS